MALPALLRLLRHIQNLFRPKVGPAYPRRWSRFSDSPGILV